MRKITLGQALMCWYPRAYREVAFWPRAAYFGKIFALLLPRCGVGSKKPGRGAEARAEIPHRSFRC
jgi:hypothetical protein